MIPKTPTNASAAAPRGAAKATSPDDEEVFLDTQEDTREGGSQPPQSEAGGADSKRRSDRKRSIVNYSDSGRQAKKQRDSTGAAATAKNLKDIGDEDHERDKVEDKFAKLMEMITSLDKGLNKKLDRQGKEISRKLSETNTNIEESLINIDTKIHRITEEVEGLANKVKRQEEAVPSLVNKAVNEQMATVVERLQRLEGGALPPSSKESRQTADYWEARRSLRISPIQGDLKEGVAAFIVDKLGLDAAILEDLGRDAIRSLPSRQTDRIKSEVVVRFSSVRDRDLVKAAGFKLAGTNGSMRLELPSHLLGQHRALTKAAANLRKAKPRTRTYVKFEDDTLSLVMDYRLEGGTWHRLRPDQAKQAVPDAAPRKIDEVSAEQFESLLNPATGANATPVS